MDSSIGYIFNWWSGMFLASLGVLFVYFYASWQADYFKKRGIKNLPYDYPFFGHMYKVVTRKEHFKDLMERIYKSFPDQKYVGVMQMSNPFVVIRDLDIVKQITIKDFDHFVNHAGGIDEQSDPLFGNNLVSMRGEKWRDMRATLSPVFTSSKMRNMFEFIVEIGQQMTNFLMKEMEKDENRERGLLEIEMRDVFTRYTNDVIATAAFGIKINSLAEKNNLFYRMGKKASDFSGVQLLKFILFISFPKMMKMVGLTLFEKPVSDFFRKLVMDTIKNRETNGTVRHDMIELLMEARNGNLKYEENNTTEKDVGFATVDESNVGKRHVKRNWSDDEIVAQAVLFFIAGFETSATVLSLMVHEITTHPDVQKRLQDEIDKTMKECNGKLNYNALSQMKYLDMVLSETLRLWPASIATDRKCVKSYTLPSVSESTRVGYTIQAGESVWIPIYGFHRDSKYFPDPDVFDPERFSDENKHKINPMSYMPFGIGPRNCIGSRFAILEIKAVIFELMSKFDFAVTNKTPNPLNMSKKSFGLHAENGFWIGLKPRINV